MQDKKGEGGKRGHCERAIESESEMKVKNEKSSGGAEQRNTEEARKKQFCQIFKGGQFANKQKGKLLEKLGLTEDHVVEPNQTQKTDKYQT